MIKVTNRRLLIPDDDRIVGCLGDNKVEIREFEVTDSSLFNYDFTLLIRLSDGTVLPSITLTKTSGTDSIILTWIVLKEHIKTDNKIQLILEAKYGEKIWHSEMKSMFVYDGY